VRPAAETAVLREYRHLLRTGPVDWQETAHRHALTALGSAARTQLLGEVHRLLLVGTRLHPDDVHEVARLLVLAERHRPRILLDGMRPDLLRLLARAVVGSPAGATLAVGRELWDGTDPLPPVAHDPPGQDGVGWSGEWGTGVTSPDLGAAFYGSVPPRRRR